MRIASLTKTNERKRMKETKESKKKRKQSNASKASKRNCKYEEKRCQNIHASEMDEKLYCGSFCSCARQSTIAIAIAIAIAIVFKWDLFESTTNSVKEQKPYDDDKIAVVPLLLGRKTRSDRLI